ncbi:unnamed protein product [Ectocarpus sp. CCAP 1310/34]|nr:unnamed protein product [Ectocarpus sp. CCAP 1310/34]
MYTCYGVQILPQNLGNIWNETKVPPFAQIFRQDLGAGSLAEILPRVGGSITPHRPRPST